MYVTALENSMLHGFSVHKAQHPEAPSVVQVTSKDLIDYKRCNSLINNIK